MTDGTDGGFRLPPMLVELIKLDVVNEYSSIAIGPNGWTVNGWALAELHRNVMLKSAESEENMAFMIDQTERHERLERIEKLWIEAQRDLLAPADVQKLLKVSKATFYRMVAREDFPKSVDTGHRTPRWHRSDIDAWLAASKAPKAKTAKAKVLA